VQFPQLIVGFVLSDMVGTARTCEARVRAIYAKWRVSLRKKEDGCIFTEYLKLKD
jgi:hypothetical protein